MRLSQMVQADTVRLYLQRMRKNRGKRKGCSKMSKLSWYTIVHPDYEGWPAPPLYRLVGPAIEESGETTCDIYFKPNRKGGHTHFHSFNASVRKNDRRKIKLKFKKALLVAEFTNIMCQCLGLDPLYGLDPKIINRINQIKKRRSHMACGGKKSGGKKPPKK